MNDGPFYVYNPKEQYQQPLFVAYNMSDVVAFADLLGFSEDEVHVSRTRLHPYERDRYKSMGSDGPAKKARLVP